MNSCPLFFGKENTLYQIDKIVGNDNTSKRLVEMGFVKNSVIELVSNQNKGVVVKLLGSKIAIDYIVAQKIYVHEYKLENIETL